MGRRKIEIKAIKDDRNRSVTFLKRKGGLFKKAHELSVLCSVDVAVIIFGHNKKLYEFSSGDIRETLGKYQYYGPPHEHKGPADFAGKITADDDDDDDASPGPDDLQPQNHALVAPHLQNASGFQGVNHAPSVSPPLSNGVAFDPRHSTPQPQSISRPPSRSHIRGPSLVSQQHQHPQAHATPPPQNRFAYLPNPSLYNPNANSTMNQQSSQPRQFQQLGHPPGPPQPHPSQGMPQHHHHQRPTHHHLAQQPPHHLPQQPPHHLQHGLPQPSHQQITQMSHEYLQDQDRHSMPPTFPAEQQQRPIPLPEQAQPQPISTESKPEGSESPPQLKAPETKSRSIFTPIDDQGSALARHFGVGPPMRESSQNDLPIKPHPSRNGLVAPKTSAPPTRGNRPGRAATDPQRPQLPLMQDISPPSRNNSVQSNSKPRPRLTVQIPSEQSDGDSATADSSPQASTENKTPTPSKVPSDTGPSGVVLPPPSPSAGTLVSAGAQGPPNPFARPPPPATNSQNGASYSTNNNMDTPISALPSRFVSDALLPSPSSFFPEWGFGRSGPDSSMLPSPLTFQTPSVQTGAGFLREDELEKKRKSPEGGAVTEMSGKKLKT